MESIHYLKSLTLDDNYYNKPVKKHVWEFSLIFATIVLAIGAYKVLKTSDLPILFACFVVASLLVILGKYIPKILIYPWRSWMIFGVLLGSIVSVVILTVLWFAMLTPIAGILKLLGVKVMDTEYKTSAESYWKSKEAKKQDFKLLEKQF